MTQSPPNTNTKTSTSSSTSTSTSTSRSRSRSRSSSSSSSPISISRLSAFLLIAIIVFEAIESTDCNKHYARHTAPFQFREKPRATRGFKSVALSTARGFGKRDTSFKADADADLGYGLLDVDSPSSLPFSASASGSGSGSAHKVFQKDSFPVDWLVEEMQNDPELMRTLIRKFIDTNRDDEISADELIRPDILVQSAKPSSNSNSNSNSNLNFEEEQ